MEYNDEQRKVYGEMFFYGKNFYDYRDLENNPLHVHFVKNKDDDGYYLGMYIQYEPNEKSVKITSIQQYSREVRKHSDWLMAPNRKFEQRLRYIQALLDI
ncbi:hypothetical protein MHTCC0001_32180 [Flavobacteriaceae bacterium MHTCC 0001]